jgi:hypothetical protein
MASDPFHGWRQERGWRRLVSRVVCGWRILGSEFYLWRLKHWPRSFAPDEEIDSLELFARSPEDVALVEVGDGHLIHFRNSNDEWRCIIHCDDEEAQRIKEALLERGVCVYKGIEELPSE